MTKVVQLELENVRFPSILIIIFHNRLLVAQHVKIVRDDQIESYPNTLSPWQQKKKTSTTHSIT